MIIRIRCCIACSLCGDYQETSLEPANDQTGGGSGKINIDITTDVVLPPGWTLNKVGNTYNFTCFRHG